MSENLDRQRIGGHSENNLTVTSNLRYSNSYLAHKQNTHTKLIIIVNESGNDEGYLLPNIACPDDYWSIQLKRWQVIFRAIVGNR